MRLTPYIEFSDRTFSAPNGSQVVAAFLTSGPEVMMLPVALAQQLRAGGQIDSIPPEIVHALRERRVLVHDSEAERARVLEQLSVGENDTTHRTFVLLPTSYCNMGCSYCGQEHTKGRLGEDHRSRIMHRVHAAITDPQTRSLHIAWFGAEPMMAYAEILDMSRSFTELAEAHGVEYTSKITTNGALLTSRKLAVLVSECRINRLDITIDGPKHIHDVHRPLKSGRGSFEDIVETLTVAAADPAYADVQFVLRTNIDRHNVDFVYEYLSGMAERGLTDARFIYQLAPIHSWGNDISELAQGADVAEREAAWFRQMDDLGLNHKILPAELAKSTCVASHIGSEVLDQFGRVYSCTEQPLVPRDIRTTMLTTASALAKTARRPRGSYDSRSAVITEGAFPCKHCSLLPLCGGGCPKRWQEGDVACPSMRRNIGERLTIAAERAGYQPVAQFA
ncbi:radical SAM protein [Microbacterium paludicola]|uniref:radical SAM protein n=1 Tax=Microbacterium paludicola TaxID=300019 RepID=UPI003879899D